MTIIEPKKNKQSSNFVVIGLILLLTFLAYWSVSIYNQTVNLRHALGDGEQELQNLKVANAELKNSFFQLTDPKNLISLGQERGLVKITAPHYLELAKNSTWSVVSASR